MDEKEFYAAPSRTRTRCHRQRGYALLGMEVDRDVDATDVAIHLWPVTIELTMPPKGR